MKNYLLIFAIFFSISLTFFFTYENKKETITADIYNSKIIEIKKMFANEVNKKKGNTAALTYIISKDAFVKESLLKNDKTLLNFTQELENIQHFSNNKNLWIQIIDKNGFSFYRSWTDQVGDNSALARLDIQEMIKTPKEMITIRSHLQIIKNNP